YADDVLIFLDEPIFSAIGSSTYLGVSREESMRLLAETALTIKDAGGIPGIHCCANADWSLAIESGAKVISFDAYGYFENLAMYYSEIKDFLEKGGYLAWGMVPTTDAIEKETPETIIDKFLDRLQRLSAHIPQKLLLSQMILTPSCGTGSRSVEETIKIFQLLMRLKEACG
ncbi:MAG TPA: hypothetical protein VEI28_05215, partial [Thermodesulfovibrionales bacterium]|nr:hypothetical protein [Thermodesulfovibrionales bacterium]